MWIEFDKIENVRDLGGLPAADGRKIKPGRLLRGAGLDRVSERDVERLTALPLRHIVDFRDKRERTEYPDREIPGAEYHSLQALPALPAKIPPDATPDFDFIFRRLYAKLAESPEAAAAYQGFFRVLLESREGAVYFHCTQGKDRTGVAALLALTALGVPHAGICADYFLSNIGLLEAMEHPKMTGDLKWPREVREKLFFVCPQTLAVYLDSLTRDWGGPKGYIRERLGLTDADLRSLRENYLE